MHNWLIKWYVRFSSQNIQRLGKGWTAGRQPLSFSRKGGASIGVKKDKHRITIGFQKQRLHKTRMAHPKMNGVDTLCVDMNLISLFSR